MFPCVEQEHGNNEQPKQQTLVPPQQDFVLQTLVKTANKHGLEICVTLNVGGTTISGDLIGGKTFSELLEAKTRSFGGKSLF